MTQIRFTLLTLVSITVITTICLIILMTQQTVDLNKNITGGLRKSIDYVENNEILEETVRYKGGTIFVTRNDIGRHEDVNKERHENFDRETHEDFNKERPNDLDKEGHDSFDRETQEDFTSNKERSDDFDKERHEDSEKDESNSETNVEETKDSTDIIVHDDETIITDATYKTLQRELKCNNRDYESERKMRGDYWVLQNYAKAGHGPIDCYRYVTFVTQGDFTFMDKLENVVSKWQSPISIALHAPGTDFLPTIQTLRYMRDCSSARELISHWTSFHIFFHKDHIPDKITSLEDFKEPFNCSLGKPYQVDSTTLYKNQKKLVYPINVGRNIGRDAALTHYFLSLDIELYPIPKLGARFLNMLARNTSYITGDRPRVYVLTPFEVEANQTIPENKTMLQRMLREKSAVPFHKYVCPYCHSTPIIQQWLKEPETKSMEISALDKRKRHWEPLFISTHSLPYLDERLSWDGMRDKMTQAYILCVMDYDFMILSNAFVTHHPGVKRFKKDEERDEIVKKQWKFLKEVLRNEFKRIYGEKKECFL